MRHLIFATCLLPLLMGSARGADSNLLANGDFEDGLDGWVFASNSGRATATVDRKVKKQGRRALHIAKTGGMPFDVLRADIETVAPGTRVEVSAQVMGKAVGNAFLKFWVYDAAGTSLVEDVDVVRLRGSFKWKRVEKTYDLPATAARVAVMVLMVMDGDLWIDDVRVEGKGGPEPLAEDIRAWLDDHAKPLDPPVFDAEPDDLEPLARTVGQHRIVLLGEESHGDGPAFRAKARLIKHLHETQGYDVLAFEAGLLECEAANALLAEGKVREAMFASVPGVWRVEEVRPLFEYLAARAKSERPLRLTGFDLQATGAGALELGARVQTLLGEEAFPATALERLRSAVERIWDGKEPLTSRERKSLRADVEGAQAAIETHREALVIEHGESDVALVQRALENFRQWEEARAKPKRGEWHAVNARDARMADNLLWLAGERYPQAKILGWGATMHFMHGVKGIREGGKRPYRGCRPMGEIVHEQLGEDVYVLAFAAHHGSKGTPFWGPFPLDPAPAGSIEDLLHRYGKPWLFVDLRETPKGPLHQKRQAGPLGYSRTMTAVWPDVIDGLIFRDENVPSTVLVK